MPLPIPHIHNTLQKRLLLQIILGALFLSSCAPERNTTFSKTYHNTTSKYNAWFVANEDIKAIELDLLSNYEWNYDHILPVFPLFDSSDASGYKEQLDHCIEKASLAIQYHKESNWEDNSYILVGKARFYGMDYTNAIETFKYVNTKAKGDDEKHEALIDLMRTYIEANEMNNATAVVDHLKKKGLNNANKRDLHLTRAYFSQKENDFERMVVELTLAEPLISNHKERARINFILGQLHQQLGNNPIAYEHYREVLRHNPSYELSFHTKLNMGQVAQITEEHSIKKVRKYFERLLKDRKNEEYQDKIYYEYARFEIRNNNLDLGIRYFKSSIQKSVNNDRQKGYSYWALGQIYYDSMANYRLAKAYYDSTVSVMPRDEEQYEQISERQAILENFVTQLIIIEVNDSLLSLVNLPKDSLESILAVYIAQKEAEENARRKEERRQRRLAAVNNTYMEEDPSAEIASSNFDGDTWYFYSTSLLSKGASSFKSRWGDRKLEDNWRIASRPPDVLEDTEVQPITENTPGAEEPSEDKQSSESPNEESIDEEFTMDFSEVMAGLPTSAEQQQDLLVQIEEASYLLANTYYFDLFETKNAIETYEGLLSRFPKTKYRIEVMYQLYLIYTDQKNSGLITHYRAAVLNEAPESIYAKLILNPNFREDTKFESQQLQLIYKKAYQLYKLGSYDSANYWLDKGLAKYLDNDYIDNAVLLKAVISGKTSKRYKYESNLRNFIRDFPDSEGIAHAQSLISTIQDYHINTLNSSRARYMNTTNSNSFFALVYETKKNTPDSVAKYMGQTMSIEPSHLFQALLDEEHTVLYVDQENSFAHAQNLNLRFETENIAKKISLTGEYHNFVITEENFTQLYLTKELVNYLDFYNNHYQLP